MDPKEFLDKANQLSESLPQAQDVVFLQFDDLSPNQLGNITKSFNSSKLGNKFKDIGQERLGSEILQQMLSSNKLPNNTLDKILGNSQEELDKIYSDALYNIVKEIDSQYSNFQKIIKELADTVEEQAKENQSDANTPIKMPDLTENKQEPMNPELEALLNVPQPTPEAPMAQPVPEAPMSQPTPEAPVPEAPTPDTSTLDISGLNSMLAPQQQISDENLKTIKRRRPAVISRQAVSDYRMKNVKHSPQQGEKISASILSALL